ncbi:T9SS type A sorting domain-containing protein [Polaribacter porphyrae]|nr:T9SS type A sorting domain-containing protein [Polaribacter porphyrae]
MNKKTTFKITALFLFLLGSVYSQVTINATSSGFTRENSTVDGASNGSFTFQNLPIKRPSFAGTGTDGRKNYFNFDYNSIANESITDASFNVTFSSISNAGNDGGFTLILKAYIEDSSSLPLEPNMNPYDFTGYTEYTITEKVFNGGGDYPTAGTILKFDVRQFLIDRLAETSPKTKVLFELSIKSKITDNTFFGNIASSLNSDTTLRPQLVFQGPALSINKFTKESFKITHNRNLLNISFNENDVNFKLMNINGQVIGIKNHSNSSVTFNTEGLSNGIYIVSASNKSSFYSFKIAVGL